nr:glycosyltransferase family 2 protein [Parvularcula dongshanensis]
MAVTLLRGVLLGLSLSADERPAPPPVKEDDLPSVTILCPLYREAAALPNLSGAIAALDYPPEKLDVKLLLEADDEATIAAARALSPPFPLDLVLVPAGGPRTKPKACNHGLWSARGDLLVIYDAEDRPEPCQLRKAAAAFASLPPEVVCLQARLNYYNRRENWVTRLFAIEYALLFDLVLPGLDRIGAPLPLGGTSNIFKRAALIEVGGWDPCNVTEDADLGLRLVHWGYRTRILDSTTFELATSRPVAWLRQRSRWIKGYMQSWAVHARRGPRRGRLRHALTLHLLVGAVIVAALLNPVFWAFYLLWWLGHGDGIAALFPGILAPMAVATLLLGNAFQVWLFMLAPLRRGWDDLVPMALLAPLYWALQSVAGYKAAWQFVTKPHYWEKTEHGAGESAEVVLGRVGAA